MAGLQTVVYETGVSAIGAGGPTGGWVSGDVASLGLSASVDCLFDLGPEWRKIDRVTVLARCIGPSSGFSNVQASFSDTTTKNTFRAPPAFGATGTWSTNLASSLLTSANAQGVNIPCMGRYLTVAVTNADGANATGATSKVIVAAM